MIDIVLSLLWVLVGSIPFETANAILEAVFTAITQGVLVAGASAPVFLLSLFIKCVKSCADKIKPAV